MNPLYNIPNVLTMLRIAMIPAIVVLFYLPYAWSDVACGLCFALAGITDSFDGYLARKWGQVSPLGEFLDPVADKLIVAVALVLIVARDVSEAAFAFNSWQGIGITLTAAVIIGREIAISALREWMAEIGARGKVAVSGLGKWKTILQVVGLSMLLFRQPLFGLPIHAIGLFLTVVAAVLTLWSMVSYLKAAWPDLRGDRRA